MTKLPFDFSHPIFNRASTFQEVADFLHTDITFVEREARRGKLVVRKFSHKMVRILPSDLVAWLEAAIRAPKAAPQQGQQKEVVAA